MQSGRVVYTKDVYGFDLKVGRFELASTSAITTYVSELPTCLMTQPRGSEASAPGKTYLFILIQLVEE